MPLSDLTRDSVLAAIAEYDTLGREAFLAKYSFSPARSYFIEHDGKRYDSKAIAGAAHGFLPGSEGPLTASDFSGGEQTVAKRLRALGFDVRSDASRNPTWTRDELILALDLYMRHRRSPPGKESREVADLSRELNLLGARLVFAASETYRNANGVYMKLMNLRALDPDFTSAGKTGLKAGGKTDQAVWDEYASRPQALTDAAAAIRAALTAPDTDDSAGSASDDDLIAEAPEGRLVTRIHVRRERNRKIVKAKKARHLKEHGNLACEACGFDFEKAYGPRGAGFAECHHKLPVSQMRPGDNTKLTDLAILCANCHRMVHAAAPWLSLEDLREIVGKGR